MDVITAKLSRRRQRQLKLITDIWSFVMIAYCIAAMLIYAHTSDLYSPVLGIPLTPFIYFAALGCALLFLTLLHDVLASMLAVLEDGGMAVLLATLALAMAGLFAAGWFMHHRIPGMSAVALGIWGIAFMFFLFFMGMPVAYALMAASFVFLANMRSPAAAWNMLGSFWYGTVSSYDWSPLMFFLLIETIIQVTLPELHVTWLCVTLLSVLYFIYCSEMWNQLDALTGLLNQNSYLNRTAEMRRRGGVLVVFDVDDFKQINDRYGHLQGDICLAEIGRCIKKAYARSGYCYRTGGDEFCVLMENADREAQCAQEFVRQLEQRRKAVDFLPTVSFGSAPFLGEDVLAVKNRADREMYRYKKARKPDAAGEMV